MTRAISAFIFSCALAACSCELDDGLQVYDKSCVGENKFPCTSGGCIDGARWCDTVEDCPDGTDENFCENRKADVMLCNVTHQFLCADGSRCIQRSWLCNNEAECPDKSDEANCTDATPPAANATCKGFQCADGKCISLLWVCDGRNDCSDSGDELEASCRHSRNTHEISEGSLCNEFPGEKRRHYRCVDASYCLPPDYMCNGIPDCRDGSDEGPFCRRWDKMCDKSTCKDNATCVPDRQGAECICELPTFKYNFTAHHCEIVDDCLSLIPLCSQKCSYHDGNSVCSCEEGYIADKTNHLCYATGLEGLLFLSTPSEIKFIKLNSMESFTITSDAVQAHGVSFDGRYVYWVQRAGGHRAVLRARTHEAQASTEILLAMGLEDPGNVAIDHLGGNMYLTDVAKGFIIVCKTNGMMCAVLRSKTKHPKFITLDPPNGKMYWADTDYSPVIMEALMDGTKPKILVDTLRSFANGLALDRPNDRLYYIDETVKVVRLSDSQVYSLFRKNYHHPYAIAVFENSVYWSEWISNSVLQVDKMSNSKTKTLVAKLNTHVTGIHVYHPLLYQASVNPCDKAKCSHLCLVTSNSTYQCACPTGYYLEGEKCHMMLGFYPEYLVVGSGANFTRIQLDVYSNPQIHTTVFDIGTVKAMTVDPNDTLYIYDGQHKSINYIRMADFSLGITHVLIATGLLDVMDMGYDYASQSLFWVDGGAATVEVYSFRTKQRAIVHRFTGGEKPIGLCVLVEYGILMVAVRENDISEEVHIDSLTMDGKQRKHLIINNLKGPRVMLRYSFTAQHVFVLDEGGRMIDIISPDGTHRENFIALSSSLRNLAVSDSFVFWTGRKSNTLFWATVQEVQPKVMRMDLSLFAPSSLLLEVTMHPLTSAGWPEEHTCMSDVCSHVCVQLPHDPPPLLAPRPRPPQPYSCLCPPTMMPVDNHCVERRSCKIEEFYCKNSNECFEKTAICDGKIDCLHGEDEEGCERKLVCGPHEINCKGQCVDVHQGCETISNTTKSVECTVYEFSCHNDTSFCLDLARRCDGTTDCADGSDELQCGISLCDEDMFQCASGACIINSWKCDGENDCEDGSDELNCSKKSCALGYFQCDSGECVSARRRCDSRRDCRDASDERRCGPPQPDYTDVVNQECAAWDFACELNVSICLPLTSRCNGQEDCPGGTDEVGCDECSQHGLFYCSLDKKCVSITQVCDGKNHCTDGADETQDACDLAKKRFPSTHHYAKNAHADCTGFRCLHGECLDWSQVCDGNKDCFNDEGPLCSKSCANVSCSQSCHASPAGPRCTCGAGFLLAADFTSCTDIDECGFDVCPQFCHNAPGTYVCSCHRGYGLRVDHRSCKALSGQLSVLFVQGTSVRVVEASGEDALYYRDPFTKITDITYQVKNQLLYITDATNGKLLEVNSTKASVVVSNIGKPTKVTVDWATGNIYFVDSSPDDTCIRVCNVGKKHCAKLQTIPKGRQVTAIAVDPLHHLLFYCVTQDLESIVFSSSLYGKNIIDVTTARNCTGLAVDTFLSMLYIAESTGFSRVGYDGANRRTITTNDQHFESPMGLALFEDHIYFLVANSFKFNRCLLYGNKRCEPYYWRVFDANTFVLRHESTQRDDIQNPCKGVECGGVCVSASSGAMCVCANGSLLGDKNCKDVNIDEIAVFTGWVPSVGAHVSAPLLGGVVAALTVYAAFFAYYHFVYRKKHDTDYTEVRFTQNQEGTSSSDPVIDMAAAGHGGAPTEFSNPLQMIRDVWRASFRTTPKPVGTAGLTINIPKQPEQDLSDTESDLDDKDTKKIMHPHQYS